MRFLFSIFDRWFFLSESCGWTSDDAGAVGDLQVHVLEGGLAVHAIDVESSGSTSDIESLSDGQWSVDGGKLLKTLIKKLILQ